MGHSVIQCDNCGASIMEGRNDWHCDECGWYSGNGIVEMRMRDHQRRFVRKIEDSNGTRYILYKGWEGQLIGEYPMINWPYITTTEKHIFESKDVKIDKMSGYQNQVDLYLYKEEGGERFGIYIRCVIISSF